MPLGVPTWSESAIFINNKLQSLLMHCCLQLKYILISTNRNPTNKPFYFKETGFGVVGLYPNSESLMLIPKLSKI